MSFRALVLALLLVPAPLLAQGPALPIGMSDADALAEQMRRVGANPLDLDALLTAGELSLRLEDYSAAGAFFARAEKIDPRNGRAKAGEGAIMVHLERPAESLRYFAQAEQFGLSSARFAAERGLAYDLLGDPGRAQRDYRLAQATRDDPETRRRHALSLANAGRQAQALDQLAPLIRQNDRAAWRTRAFVLAMGGNAAEALRIAETMMPPGAAASLRQFFTELPRLPAIDRAFAVHFGEVRASPQRLADARLAPRDAPLALEPLRAPVQVAVAPPEETRRERRDRDSDRDRRRGETVVAAIVPAPAPPPLPQPPAYQAPVYRPQPYVPAATNPARDRPLTSGELASLAAAGNRMSRRASPSTAIAPPATPAPATVRPRSRSEQASLAAAAGRVAERPVGTRASLPPTRPPVAVAAVPSTVAITPARAPAPAAQRPVTVAATMPPPTRVTGASIVATVPPVPRPSVGTVEPQTLGRPASVAPSLRPAITLATTPSAAPVTMSIVAAPSVGAAAAPPAAAVEAAPVSGFSTALTSDAPVVLASGPESTGATSTDTASATPPVATDSAVPTAMVTTALPSPLAPTSTPPAPLIAPAPAPVAAAAVAIRPPAQRGRAQTDAVLARIVARLSIPASELDVTPGRGQAAPTAAERRAVERRLAADRKAVADRKAAAAAKVEADREAAEQRRIARSEPPRLWVQVAGGANEAGLALAWSTMRGRAPAALTGRQAWTTPLRATNRVLTGPFSTDAEARALVNQLGKAGVQAFTFTSEAGQKVTRLAAR